MLSTMCYLPPALFDRLRVKCCSLTDEQYNWEKSLLLGLKGIKVRARVQEDESPAIVVSGRSPKEDLNELWEVLLRIVQVTIYSSFPSSIGVETLFHRGGDPLPQGWRPTSIGWRPSSTGVETLFHRVETLFCRGVDHLP